MSNELIRIAEWSFIADCKPPAETLKLLIEGERVLYACKTIRDVAVFTDRRLIVCDLQGLTGKKTYNIPYRAINMYTVEKAKAVDFDAELELWTRAGQIKINLARGCDIREIDAIIAAGIMR